MAFSRPQDLDHLLLEAEQRGHNPADGVDIIMERPEDNGIPDVVVLVDDPEPIIIISSSDEEDDNPHPIIIISSSDEEDDDDDDDGNDVLFVPAVGPFNPLNERINHRMMVPMGWEDEDTDDEDTDDEDTDDEDTDDEESEADSGYESFTEDEEEEEDQDLPEVFLQRLHPLGRPIFPLPPSPPFRPSILVGFPSGPSVSPPTGPPVAPPAGCSPGPLSIPQRPETCLPSTSGLVSSLKRSREESSPKQEQVSTKRQRTDDEDLAPSMSSSLSSSTNRGFWHAPSHHTGWSDDSDSD